MTIYFETTMPFDMLLSGIGLYHVKPNEYFMLQVHTDTTLIGTNSSVLIERFRSNNSFREIELTREELYFKMGDVPVIKKAGNPNLIPLI